MKSFLALFILLCTTALAGPLEVIVPNTPGGASDLMGRKTITALSDKGISAVIQYVPGASGNLGIRYLLSCKSDCVLIGTSGVIVNRKFAPEGYPENTTSLIKPLHVYGLLPAIVIVPSSSPVKTLPDFIKLSQTRNVSVGHGGVGTAPYFALQDICKLGSCLEIPYKSSSAGLVDVMSGRLDALYATLGFNLKNDKIKAVAIFNKTRALALPDIPTALEQGVNITSIAWLVLFHHNLPLETATKIKTAMKSLNEDQDLIPVKQDVDEFWREELVKYK
jgi:tripartite-type tricarboxylate transporter receptor subunit TctC